MNRPEWHWALLGSVGSGGLGIMMPAFSLALSNIISVFFNPDFEKQKSVIRTWCIVFAVVGAGAFACGVVQQFAFTLMGQKLARRVRVLLMQSLLRQVCSTCFGFAAFGCLGDQCNKMLFVSSVFAVDKIQSCVCHQLYTNRCHRTVLHLIWELFAWWHVQGGTPHP